MSDDFLPDCRARERRGAVRTSTGTKIPVYCANCGKHWGLVPEEMMTFAFVLCEGCAEKHGDIAHVYKEPDSVFWARVEEAQRETAGRLMTLPELALAIDENPAFRALARDWTRHVRKDL